MASEKRRPATGKTYKEPSLLHPERSAAEAGLRYVTDAAPGITRRRAGKGFVYVTSGGTTLRDAQALKRIRRLAIPPAWKSVWVCPDPVGHLQATGLDARGRKQYRYHTRWREIRDETKFSRMIGFAGALPRIRRQVSADLGRPGLPREKVLAAVVRLLDRTYMRVGNEEYARDNASFGLTTLRERQAKVRGATLKLEFRGKSGVQHRITVSDPRLAPIVRRMQDLPGEDLFCYIDEAGEVRAINSADVNGYLKAIAGEAYTSKDFRTWAGTRLCAQALQHAPAHESEAAARKTFNGAVEKAAAKLGNTKAVCRKCYIHPAVERAYRQGWLQKAMQGRGVEKAIVALLREDARRETREADRSGASGASLLPLLARSLRTPARRLLQPAVMRTTP